MASSDLWESGPWPFYCYHLLALTGFLLFLIQKVQQNTQRELLTQTGCSLGLYFTYYLWRCWLLVNLMRFIVCLFDVDFWLDFYHPCPWSWLISTNVIALMKFQCYFLLPSVWFQNSLTPMGASILYFLWTSWLVPKFSCPQICL